MRLQHDETVRIVGDRRRDGAATSDDLAPPSEGSTLDPALREQVRRRRTFAINSHPDAGKSTPARSSCRRPKATWTTRLARCWMPGPGPPCSGRFVRDMEVVNARTGEKLRIAGWLRLFAQDREAVEEAFPGDLIGLSSTGRYRPGDALHRGNPSCYEPLPRFAPEHFAVLSCRERLRRKQFARGTDQLVEGGAIRAISDPDGGGRAQILTAVGPL